MDEARIQFVKVNIIVLEEVLIMCLKSFINCRGI